MGLGPVDRVVVEFASYTQRTRTSVSPRSNPANHAAVSSLVFGPHARTLPATARVDPARMAVPTGSKN